MSEIQEFVAKWREIYEERKELEQLAEALKKGPEAEAENEILTWLKLTGQQAARLPDGAGTVARKVITSVWTADAAKAAQMQLERFKVAEAEHRPLTDELLFQQRPSKSLALSLAEADLAARGLSLDFNNLNNALAAYGFKAVETESLSFTKR